MKFMRNIFAPKKLLTSPHLLVFLFFLIRLPNVRTGLNDFYQFRQTQTAWGIREVESGGLDFLHLQLPVLGKPFQIPFEFPFFQNVAGVVGNWFSLSPSTAGRLVSLSFYCISISLLIILTRLILKNSKVLYFLPMLMLTPYALEWSDACLIESSAIFFLLVSLIFLTKYFNSGRWIYLILVLASNSLAALIKITTVVPSVFLFMIFLIVNRGESKLIKRNVTSLLCVGFSLLPAVLWTRYADSIKSKSTWTSWLTSRNLMTWNFGTIQSRIVLRNWEAIAARIWIIGSLFIVWGIYLAWCNRKSYDSLVLFLTVVSPIFIYFNLYVVHDYYYLAIIFFLVFYISYLSSTSPRFSNANFLGLIVVLSLFVSWSIPIPHRNYVIALTGERSSIPELSEIISMHTKPKDEILVVGCDWDPSVLYYANRTGISAPLGDGDVQSVVTKLYESPNKNEISYLAICPGEKMPVELQHANISQVDLDLYALQMDKS